MRATRESHKAWTVLLPCLLLPASIALGAAAPDLIVLARPARSRQPPVLQIHPRSAEIAGRLSRGFGRRRCASSAWSRPICTRKTAGGGTGLSASLPATGRVSAVRVLSSTRPRSRTPDTSTSTRAPVAGEFGAMDQIFPHELAHVIQRQLAGETPSGRNEPDPRGGGLHRSRDRVFRRVRGALSGDGV